MSSDWGTVALTNTRVRMPTRCNIDVKAVHQMGKCREFEKKELGIKLVLF